MNLPKNVRPPQILS
jgi:hypothetical protein